MNGLDEIKTLLKIHLEDYPISEKKLSKLTGVDNVKGTLVTISLRKNPVSVNILNAEAIPEIYRVVIPESWQPDKKAILTQFKNTGEIVDGVEIVNDKKHLEIK